MGAKPASVLRGSGGHTLLELATVLALVTVATALAYPSAAGLRRGQDLEGAAVALLHDLRLAQWRAVSSGRRVRLTAGASTGGAFCYRIDREEGGSWTPEGGPRCLPAGAVLTAAGPAAKVFNPDGTSSSGSLTVQGAGAALFRFTLTPATGRVRFYRGAREVARAR
jgi:type II secretory pathway pseudopilin PulG